MRDLWAKLEGVSQTFQRPLPALLRRLGSVQHSELWAPVSFLCAPPERLLSSRRDRITLSTAHLDCACVWAGCVVHDQSPISVDLCC
mgnify:CR=1 FL=1